MSCSLVSYSWNVNVWLTDTGYDITVFTATIIWSVITHTHTHRHSHYMCLKIMFWSLLSIFNYPVNSHMNQNFIIVQKYNDELETPIVIFSNSDMNKKVDDGSSWGDSLVTCHRLHFNLRTLTLQFLCSQPFICCFMIMHRVSVQWLNSVKQTVSGPGEQCMALHWGVHRVLHT